MAGPSDPTGLNARFWRDEASVADYEYEGLSPAESLLLEQHRTPLSGTVLELGPGAGRVTRHLAAHAAALTALEISPAMAEACRRNVPAATVEVRDMRDLGDLASGSVDAVVASNNVLDVLDHDERQALLRELRRLLGPGGVLLFSSHNKDGRSRRPWQPRDRYWLAGVVGDIRNFPRSMRNHRRLRSLEHEEADYALRNDEAHDFSMILYNVSAPAQARHLADAGFALAACMTDGGEPVDLEGPPSRAPFLHYAASAIDVPARPR